jgi:SAM-dependent methyltransferase
MSVVREYDSIARDYCEKGTVSEKNPIRERFISYLQENDLILDAGCGPGADTKAFLKQGFRVVALDGSKEMVKFAADYTGEVIHHVTFEEMEFDYQFDALWTSFSLVHHSKEQLLAIIPKFISYLKDAGHWYISFLYGKNEYPDAPIPTFRKTEESLRGYLKLFPQLEEQEMWVTQGQLRNGNASDFLHCILKKTPIV